jgi:hypothetical protein
MEVSILSKGETLTSTWPKVGVGAITVAVNQAIVVAPSVDWLCMLDVDKMAQERVPVHLQCMVGLQPKVGVFTAEGYVPFARNVYPGKTIVGSDRIQRIGHDRMPLTSLAALWFATQYLGATVLHLHGYDLGGVNCLGKEESVERGGRRWPEERKLIAKVCQALRDRGCEIHSYGAFKP